MSCQPKSPVLSLWMWGLLWVLTTLSACRPDDKGPTPGPPVETDPPFAWALPGHWTSPFPEPTDNLATVGGVALGEQLFFDPILSLDSTVSCATCHRPATAFGDPAPVSRGVENRPGRRNTMSIANLRWERDFFWDGRAATLEEQIRQPILEHDEMAATPALVNSRLSANPTYRQAFATAFGGAEPELGLAVKALSQYVRTLISATSLYDRYLMGHYTPTAAELRGMRLFFTHPEPAISLRGGNCGDCHMPITTGGAQIEQDMYRNNGHANPDIDPGRGGHTGRADDRGRFRVPSLRNVALTAPYMHDGQLQTLEDVLDHYNHPDLFSRPGIDPLISEATNSRFGRSLGLTDQEKADIITFMHMLSDTTFVNFHARRHP